MNFGGCRSFFEASVFSGLPNIPVAWFSENSEIKQYLE